MTHKFLGINWDEYDRQAKINILKETERTARMNITNNDTISSTSTTSTQNIMLLSQVINKLLKTPQTNDIFILLNNLKNQILYIQNNTNIRNDDIELLKNYIRLLTIQLDNTNNLKYYSIINNLKTNIIDQPLQYFVQTPIETTTVYQDVNKDYKLRDMMTRYYLDKTLTWLNTPNTLSKNGYGKIYKLLKKYVNKYNINWYDLKTYKDSIKMYLIEKLSQSK